MTVHQLLNSLDSYEIGEWRQFFILEHERQTQPEPEPDVETKLRMAFK